MELKIKVRVKQAHENPLPGGGFKRFEVGQEIEIMEGEFADNLHEKIGLIKPEKEDEEDGARTKKYRQTGPKSI